MLKVCPVFSPNVDWLTGWVLVLSVAFSAEVFAGIVEPRAYKCGICRSQQHHAAAGGVGRVGETATGEVDRIWRGRAIDEVRTRRRRAGPAEAVVEQQRVGNAVDGLRIGELVEGELIVRRQFARAALHRPGLGVAMVRIGRGELAADDRCIVVADHAGLRPFVDRRRLVPDRDADVLGRRAGVGGVVVGDRQRVGAGVAKARCVGDARIERSIDSRGRARDRDRVRAVAAEAGEAQAIAECRQRAMRNADRRRLGVAVVRIADVRGGQVDRGVQAGADRAAGRHRDNRRVVDAVDRDVNDLCRRSAVAVGDLDRERVDGGLAGAERPGRKQRIAD